MFFDFLFPKKESFEKSVYVQNLVIVVYSDDKPSGTTQVNPTGAAVVRISGKMIHGKIWVDGWETPAGHELQHLLSELDTAFGRFDEEPIK